MLGLLKRKKRPIDAPAEIAGVRVKPSPRARRLTLRLDMKAGDIVLSWPRGATESSALRFIESNRDWIEQRRKALPPAKSFAEGEIILIHGLEYQIVRKDGRGVTHFHHPAEGRGLDALSAFINGGFAADQMPPVGGMAMRRELVIHCRPEHLSRRIKDFLKSQAQELIEKSAIEKLAIIGKKLAGLRVIDPKTRWGSCGPDGQMMFSWRLILAPPGVLDYIVAHEVAHRVHMNHSRKFWALCASLTENAAESRRWLKKNGNALMAYR